MPVREAEPRFLEPVLGIVFDLDGTLVLTRHDFGRIRAEVVRIAERYGVPAGRLSVQDPVHRIVENAREEMRLADLPDGHLWRFEAEYQKAVDAIELEALPRTVVRPGAPELLRGLLGRGFRLGLLTRSSEAFARAALQRTRLDGYFSYLRTRSSPGPAKPDPEALLLLLKEMGVPLDRGLFVGDHLIDTECATRARVRFYALMPDPTEAPTSEMSSDRFLAAGASAVARDLWELSRQLGAATPPRAA
jgi:phosphoglycolate phosphatase-like HAD superfamily hydrolase